MTDGNGLLPGGIRLNVFIDFRYVRTHEFTARNADVADSMVGTGLQGTETQFRSRLVQGNIAGLRIAGSHYLVIYLVPIP